MKFICKSRFLSLISFFNYTQKHGRFQFTNCFCLGLDTAAAMHGNAVEFSKNTHCSIPLGPRLGLMSRWVYSQFEALWSHRSFLSTLVSVPSKCPSEESGIFCLILFQKAGKGQDNMEFDFRGQ